MKKYFIALCLVLLTTFSLAVVMSIDAEAHSSTRMSDSQWQRVNNLQSQFGTPNVLEESYGSITNLDWKKIMKNAPTRTYWMKKMPFHLSDSGGNNYAGYCAHSFIAASKSMNVKGLVTDPRIIALVYHGSVSDSLSNPSEQTQAGVQIALWGALNTNWSPDLFSKWVSLNAADYSGNTGALAAVQAIAANWSSILASAGEPIMSVKPADKESKGRCHNDPSTELVAFAVQINTLDGKPAKDVKQIADVSVTGATVKVIYGSDAGAAEELANYRLTPAASHVYFIMKYGEGQNKGEAQVKVHIDYKNKHEKLNHFNLLVYDSGNNYQPFIMPSERKIINNMILKWDCKVPPACVPKPGEDENCNEVVDPDVVCINGECNSDAPEPTDAKSTIKEVPMRWYNMPLAFGEIKNGSGYNPTGATTNGKFATSRSEEPFETQLGVPSTEQFYVNLGGTVGIIDVEVMYKKHDQEFSLAWVTPWLETITESWTDEEGNSQSRTYKVPRSSSFSDIYSHSFETVTITSASFRTLGNGNVTQGELGISVEVNNSSPDPGSFKMSPRMDGLTPGPGNNPAKDSYGATKSWTTSASTTTSTVDGEPSAETGRAQAEDYANGITGQIFSQSDSLTITIAGVDYEITPSSNLITGFPYKKGQPSMDSTGGAGLNFFRPHAEGWDVWGKLPITGYTGNPEDDASRNVNGGVLIAENISIEATTPNGIYSFEETMESNFVEYDTNLTVIKGGESSVNTSIDELLDGSGGSGSNSSYANAVDPIEEDTYASGGKVFTHYTNFQAPVPNAGQVNFKHSGVIPDGDASSSIDTTPRYRSLNPVLIHTPTSALYTWVNDVADLTDQRVRADSVNIKTHDGVNGNTTRNYIDYSFSIHFGNSGAFDTYWNQQSVTSDEQGIVDGAYDGTGILGKKFRESAVNQVTTRSPASPYLGAGGWDVSKWTDAKYVKFPYNVYYEKNSGEKGGSPAGFYEEGTWIKLYDDNLTPRSGDPTDFNFRVSSSQKDLEAGEVEFLAEAINAQDKNPASLNEIAEWYVNGTRSTDGALEAEATYSAKSKHTVDVIGRIGNFIISDSNDPDFQSTFWNLDAKGNPKYNEPVNKEYGQLSNWFDTGIVSAKFSPYDRYGTMQEWRKEKSKLTLPMRYSTKEGKTTEAVNIGYEIGGSIQTLGDYDSEMWIYPTHTINGVPKTGAVSDKFKLVATDAFTGNIQEVYDSRVNEDLENGVTGASYNPRYKHLISNNLSKPNLKLSAREKATPEYQKAVQLGTGADVVIGNPALITIPKSLRTFIGSDDTSGNIKMGMEAAVLNSADCPCSWQNAQKWNFAFSLPQTTKVWFYEKPENSGRVPRFEPASKSVFVDTRLTARTKRSAESTDEDSIPGSSGSVSWDLATEITVDETFRTNTVPSTNDAGTVGTH